MSEKMITAVRKAAMERYVMNLGGIHGPIHWERVHENAAYLAKHSGGDPTVIDWGYKRSRGHKATLKS